MLRFRYFFPNILVFTIVNMLPAYALLVTKKNVVTREKINHDLFLPEGTVTINTTASVDLTVLNHHVKQL